MVAEWNRWLGRVSHITPEYWEIVKGDDVDDGFKHDFSPFNFKPKWFWEENFFLLSFGVNTSLMLSQLDNIFFSLFIVINILSLGNWCILYLDALFYVGKLTYSTACSYFRLLPRPNWVMTHWRWIQRIWFVLQRRGPRYIIMRKVYCLNDFDSKGEQTLQFAYILGCYQVQISLF